MPVSKFNFKDFKNLKDAFEKLNEDIDEFNKKFISKQGEAVIREAKLNTNVISGDLRNAWQMTDADRNGLVYSVTVYNLMHYASYVEDGHMNRNRTKWIPGQHILRNAISKVDLKMESKYNAALNKFFKDRGL